MNFRPLILNRAALRKAVLLGLMATTSLAAPGLVRAQEAAPAATSTLTEVVVTARRKDERLQDVPISIIAASQQTLDEKGVHNAADLSSVAPGLSIQSTASNRADTTFSIRGQGQTFGQSAPGVVAYFSDVANFSTTIYDLDNVQVLKGPQGTLFGKNTTGGAILFTPKAPSNIFNGYIQGRLGNYKRQDLEFGFGGPIIEDHIMFRIAGQSLNRDGFTKYALDGAKLDDEDRQSWRAAVTVIPFEGLKSTTLYQANRNHELGSGAVLTNIIQSPQNTPFFAGMQADLARQRQLGVRTVLGNDPLHFVTRDSKGWVNTTSWTINDHLTFKNIYSDRKFKTGQSYDLDATNATLLHVFNPAILENKVTTEEFQTQLAFGPVSGVVGYYKEDTENPRGVGFRIQQNAIGGPLLAFGPVSDIQVIGQGETSSKAFYGQGDWKVFDKLTLTAGVRRTEDEISSGPQATQLLLPLFPPPFGPALSLGTSGVLTHTFKATTWNLAANYQVNPDLNIYGTVRKGYKAGGFNGTAQSAADRFFVPETVTDYEAGIKGKRYLGSAQARYAVDVFFDDYKDIQRFVNKTGASGIPETLTQNAAAGTIKGVDLDIALIASPMFEVAFNYAYLKAEYDSYPDQSLGDLSKSRFPNTPEHQLTLTPKVNLPVPARIGTVSALATIFYQASFATDPANVPNGDIRVTQSSLGANVDGYTRVDLRADWRNIYQSHVSASAYVKNVFDREYVLGTNNQLNAATGTVASLYGEPRFFGLELRYDFGN